MLFLTNVNQNKVNIYLSYRPGEIENFYYLVDFLNTLYTGK